jgi:branched-chain amino acid transport system substrate-binding protein
VKNVSTRLARAAVVLTLGGTLAACGGSGGTGETAGVKDETIKVGVSAPLSGPLATAGTSTACGVKAYLESVNDDGGVNGYTFEVVEKDNQYDPGVAASVARDFATDGVFATVVAGTATMEASVPVLEARNVPIFGSPDGAVVSPPKWEGMFSYNAVYTREGASAVSFIKDELGEDTASSVYLSPAAMTASESFVASFQEAGGKIVANEALPPDVTDFAGMAQKLKSAGAPVVYTTLVDTQLAGLQKAADAIGYNPKWVSWAIAQGPTYLELAGDLAEGVYFSQWAIPDTQTDDPEVKKYIAAVESVSGCAEHTGDNAVKTGYGLGATIAYGVEQATEGGEAPTFDAFIEALSDVEDHQFGLTPGMSYDEESHAGVRQNSYWQVKSGQLELVRDFEPLPES